MDVFTFLFVPTILFMTVLGPIWISKHYATRRQEAKTLLSEEQEALDHLVTIAEKMENRIGNLEKILDAENPNWRTQYDDGDTQQ